jgi:glycosyltransferase involved in cell wall biosynthesis
MNKKAALIIPCYNEEQRLRGDLVAAFAEKHPQIDIWLVNDGSKDNTLAMLQALASKNERVSVLDIQPNGGKAAAIRQAVLHIGSTGVNYDSIGFIDADFSAPLEEFLLLADVYEQKRYLIAAGARVKILGRNVRRSMLRHYFGRVFASFSVTLLRLPNYDTQCGLKLFERQFALQLFEQPLFSKWFFDIELFVRAKILLGDKAYEEKVVEVPLNCWMEVGGSKLKMTDFLKAPFEVLKIYWRYRTELKNCNN